MRKHAAVAAEHDRQVGPCGDRRGVHGREPGHTRLDGRVRLDQHRAAPVEEEAPQDPDRLGDVAALVPTDQRDGLERGGHVAKFTLPAAGSLAAAC
jgi:hypothetical protein